MVGRRADDGRGFEADADEMADEIEDVLRIVVAVGAEVMPERVSLETWGRSAAHLKLAQNFPFDSEKMVECLLRFLVVLPLVVGYHKTSIQSGNDRSPRKVLHATAHVLELCNGR